MRNLKITLSYDGTDFKGWQYQPNGRTVQDEFEKAFQSITQEKYRCNVCGRTDAGVHALGQVVNIYTNSRLDGPILAKAMNAKLPEDVVVHSVEDVGESFCANKDALTKRYRYVINDSKIPDLFLRKYSWQPKIKLDAELMHQAAQALHGRHDFRSFQADYPNRMTSIRHITDICVVRHGDLIYVEVEANGFLYNMVRAITGSLYNVGRGYWPCENVKLALLALDRKQAGPTAPPQGLFMLKVNY